MQLYDKILSLPLFQGLSRYDMGDIVAHVRMGFSTANPREIIIRENDPCRQLVFMFSGTAVVQSYADGRGFSVEEYVSAPQVFEPERLFGLTQYYAHTVRSADGECGLLTLGKEEVARLCERFPIFRVNLLNLLATDVQKASLGQWKRRPRSTAMRIRRFLSSHSLRPAGRKVYNVKMQQVADETGDSRLNVSRQLNLWQAEGLVKLSRGRIDVPRLEALLQSEDPQDA